jgi:predicted HAD superfamily Cof-like phosphohydrolase
MRINFLFEELHEFATACGYEICIQTNGSLGYSEVPAKDRKVNLEEALDGLIDMDVVLLGTADLMGFGTQLPLGVTSRWRTIWSEAWERVHKANMSKERVAPGEKSKRGSDTDLIKPEGWKKPTFEDLLV